MSSYTDEADHSQNIFIWHYVSLFEEAGWVPMCHIMSPLTTEGFHADFVKKFREERRLGRLERSLVVFHKHNVNALTKDGLVVKEGTKCRLSGRVTYTKGR